MHVAHGSFVSENTTLQKKDQPCQTVTKTIRKKNTNKKNLTSTPTKTNKTTEKTWNKSITTHKTASTQPNKHPTKFPTFLLTDHPSRPGRQDVEIPPLRRNKSTRIAFVTFAKGKEAQAPGGCGKDVAWGPGGVCFFPKEVMACYSRCIYRWCYKLWPSDFIYNSFNLISICN